MRYKVPQNIDMPDRIFGPLTMIQFVEAVLGGGLAYFFYTKLPSPLGVFLAVLTGIFTAAVVFVKINERPFAFYLLAFIRYMIAPKARVWKKEGDNGFEIEMYKPAQNTGPAVQRKALNREQIGKLAEEIDKQGINQLRIRN